MTGPSHPQTGRVLHDPQRPPNDDAGNLGMSAPGWLWATLIFLIGIGLTYRAVLLHHATYSLGENGDGIIVISILEHWFHTFQKLGQNLRETGFFYPAHDTLGLTDTFFLYALPYAGSRALGFGPFFSFTVSIVSFSVVGYWGMYFLCRRWLFAASAFSAGAASIFAFGVMPVWKLLHAQTYTIMLMPSICLILLAGWRSRMRHRQLLLGVMAGLLSGLIVLSAAQTAWFLCFTGGLSGLIWLILERPHPAISTFQRIWPIAVGLLLGISLTSIPILAVYWPVASHSTREFWEVLFYSPHATDLVHVPPGTPLWSDLLHDIGLSPDGGGLASEVALGYTPGFLLVVLSAGLTLGFRMRRRGGTTCLDHVATACMMGALLSWALQLNYHAVHPWSVIFRWIPGARAIRTPFRAQLAAQFLMCLAFARMLTRHTAVSIASIRTSRPGSPQGNRNVVVLMLLGSGLTLSLVEQIGPGPVVRQNAELVSWLRLAHRPSFRCDAFYLMPDPKSTETFWQRQSDAMLLSEWLDLPTVNGSSSWVPPGWDLMHPEAPNYIIKLRQWIVMNNLQGKVCGADPHSGRWFVKPVL